MFRELPECSESNFLGLLQVLSVIPCFKFKNKNILKQTVLSTFHNQTHLTLTSNMGFTIKVHAETLILFYRTNPIEFEAVLSIW